MHRPLRALSGVGLCSTVLLLVVTPCRAEPAAAGPRRSIASSVYGGGGESELTSNESGSDIFDERHIGVGGLATLRPWTGPGGETALSYGGFLQLGLTGELRLHRVKSCVFECEEPLDGTWHPEGHFGLRLGIGYDSDLVGLRGGVLYLDSVSALIAELMVSPDVNFRLGRRDSVWVEAGVGAYDASTSLRPGVYAAFSFVPRKPFTVSLHYGLHAGIGSLGHTAIQVGARSDLGVGVDLSPRVRVGAGVSHQAPVGFSFKGGMWEGRAEASFRF